MPTFLFIEFSEQACFTGWVWRVIYMRADTLRKVNQLSYTSEAGIWQPYTKIWRQGKIHGRKRKKRQIISEL